MPCLIPGKSAFLSPVLVLQSIILLRRLEKLIYTSDWCPSEPSAVWRPQQFTASETTERGDRQN